MLVTPIATAIALLLSFALFVYAYVPMSVHACEPACKARCASRQNPGRQSHPIVGASLLQSIAYQGTVSRYQVAHEELQFSILLIRSLHVVGICSNYR